METTFRGLMRFAIWVFLLFHLFPLDVLQITPNGVFIVHRMQFLPRLEEVILELIIKNVYQSLLMDWNCVLCLKEYCSLLQLIVS